MRVLPIFPDNWFAHLLPAIEERGAEIVHDRPDAIIVGSISQLDRALKSAQTHHGVPLFAYNWDLYEWSRRDKGYDYKGWGKIMRHAKEVWHPSDCTLKRCKEWYGIGGTVIKTFIPVDQFAHLTPTDGEYALMALRPSPDHGRAWFQQACDELGIPWKSTDLAHGKASFGELLAGATLLVNPLREASTGGLFLIEGLSLGKAALVSASPWNAGRDYLGPFARTPKIDTYDAFKGELERMWEERPTHDRMEAAAFISDEYSLDVMADAVMDRLKLNL